MIDYQRFIESRFKIVKKKERRDDFSQVVPFKLNSIQDKFLNNNYTDTPIILKARQQGFSSLIEAILTTDFILEENSWGLIVADIDENAIGLLDRVKFFIQSYEENTKCKVPLKYNTRFELFNPLMNSRLQIGTAKNVELGRSKTLTSLHLSEVAFYPNIEKIFRGAAQAVTEGGRKILETTANGFNEFKKIWEDAKRGDSIYKPLFYKASDFYTPQFLANKKIELKEAYPQEYPENDLECFLSTGDCYFEKNVLKQYLNKAEKPIGMFRE